VCGGDAFSKTRIEDTQPKEQRQVQSFLNPDRIPDTQQRVNNDDLFERLIGEENFLQFLYCYHRNSKQ
jgi:hypothetical protein